MKKTLVAAAIAAAFAGPVFAENVRRSAPVMSVRPVTERTPVNREECWSEQRRGYEERRVTRQDDGAPIGAGTVLGAIAGGVLGHQVAAAAARMPPRRRRGRRRPHRQPGRSRAGQRRPRRETRGGRAPPVHARSRALPHRAGVREVPVGYDVRYRYGNREFTTRLPVRSGPPHPLAVDCASRRSRRPRRSYRR
jgi:uncharacterized protein YcfJ